MLGLTVNEAVSRRLAAVWGVHAVRAEAAHSMTQAVEHAHKIARVEGFASKGDEIVVVAGVPFGQAGTTNALRVDLTAHVLALDDGFHADHGAGELLERIDGDVAAIAGFFARFVVHVLGSALFLLGVLALLWREDWRIGALLTGFAIGSVTYLTRGGAFVGRRSRASGWKAPATAHRGSFPAGSASASPLRAPRRHARAFCLPTSPSPPSTPPSKTRCWTCCAIPSASTRSFLSPTT